MDRYAVLVFRGQPLTDARQIAFTASLGKIELNTANNVTRPEQRRLGYEMSDISNLDKDGNLLARDDRRRGFNLGNRLWHSDSSFKAAGSKYSLLSARVVPAAGGNTEFADMRAAYDALDPETKAEVENLDHRAFAPVLARPARLHRVHRGGAGEVRSVRHRLVRTNPVTGRTLALSLFPHRRHHRLAGAGGARLRARPRRARDATPIRLRPRLAPA